MISAKAASSDLALGNYANEFLLWVSARHNKLTFMMHRIVGGSSENQANQQ